MGKFTNNMINTNKTEPQIIYEDSDILVINKPAGLVVHGDGRTEEYTLCDWILEKYPNIKEVGEPMTLNNGKVIYRPGIVHRLDRETSGAMVIAKNQESFDFLKNQFKDRDVHKTYMAFVYGHIKKDDETIDRPIGRSRSDFRKWSAQRGARGEMRDAVTEYKVIERGGKKGEEATFVEIKPLTGRTHQIRVHFKAINHPIVADYLYAPQLKSILGFERTALHARYLEIDCQDGEKRQFEAPLPEDFNRALELLANK